LFWQSFRWQPTFPSFISSIHYKKLQDIYFCTDKVYNCPAKVQNEKLGNFPQNDLQNLVQCFVQNFVQMQIAESRAEPFAEPCADARAVIRAVFRAEMAATQIHLQKTDKKADRNCTHLVQN
jgi:hypothetical protein